MMHRFNRTSPIFLTAAFLFLFTPFLQTPPPPTATATIELPVAREITQTPTAPMINVEIIGTPLATIDDPGQLPQARTASHTPTLTFTPMTPTPSNTPSMSEENQLLLDTANNNTGGAGSLRVDGSGELLVRQGDEEASTGMLIEGTLDNFTDIENLLMSANLTTYRDIAGEYVEVLVEQRIIGEMFYGRGVQESTCRSTRWIAMPLTSVLGDVFLLTDTLLPIEAILSGEATPEATAETNPEATADPESPITAMLELLDFGRFAVTTREDTSGDEARFRTLVDLRGFIGSAEEFVPLIVLLARFGGVELGEQSAAQFVSLFQPILLQLVPSLQLEVIRYVDVQEQVISRVDFRLDATLSPLLFGMMGDMIEMELDAVLVLSGYGEDYPLETPVDPYFVESPDELETVTQEQVVIEGCT